MHLLLLGLPACMAIGLGPVKDSKASELAPRGANFTSLAATPRGLFTTCFNGNNAALSLYAKEAPSPTAAWSIFAGSWASQPAKAKDGSYFADTAGLPDFSHDRRVTWALETLGLPDLNNKKVLELGPLEAGHTALYHERGASITAVEGNALAYLKCLTVKEQSGLTNAHFKYGDIQAFLGDESKAGTYYDVVSAVGVLYHMQTPVKVLKDISTITHKIIMWTQVYAEGEGACANSRTKEGRFAPGEKTTEEGIAYTAHKHSYAMETSSGAFLGGSDAFSVWMEKSDLVQVLTGLGFTVTIDTEADGEAKTCNAAGNQILLVATRTPK